ncbi:type II secretion system F family protein [Micrococcus cohnii]|uniref:Tight adherence protein B n=1 Tax=Micrococcus cohnii TaxID=993416 RepID=A0A7W7GPE7_9MICC|nr:type II secretion system F family protein [Micrococcus cohnii]MBB4735854.1 tight adherence protein B [Micrococcus cohnii]
MTERLAAGPPPASGMPSASARRADAPAPTARLLRWWRRRRRDRSRAEADAALALRRWAGHLRTGLTTEQAWTAAAEAEECCARAEPGCCLGHVLSRLAAVHRLGGAPSAVAGPDGVDSWQTFTGLLELSHRTGTAPAVVAERFAAAREAELDAERARAAHAAGPRSTVTLLRWLPLGGLGLAWMLGAGPAVLLGDVLGWLVLAAGAFFTVAGHVWVSRLLRQARGPEHAVDAAAWLDVTAAQLGAGRSLVAALDDVASVMPSGHLLRPVTRALLWGAPWASAWSRLDDSARQEDVAQLRELGRRLRPLHATGAAGAQSLVQAAQALRQERARAAQLAAEQLAVRLVVPLGLCHLPAFVCLGVLPMLLAMLRGPA